MGLIIVLVGTTDWKLLASDISPQVYFLYFSWPQLCVNIRTAVAFCVYTAIVIGTVILISKQSNCHVVTVDAAVITVS